MINYKNMFLGLVELQKIDKSIAQENFTSSNLVFDSSNNSLVSIGDVRVSKISIQDKNFYCFEGKFVRTFYVQDNSSSYARNVNDNFVIYTELDNFDKQKPIKKFSFQHK